MRVVLVLFLLAGCAAPEVRYERVPVPSTPFTREKLEVNQRACEAKGKALQCVTTPRNTQDCWCAEVPR